MSNMFSIPHGPDGMRLVLAVAEPSLIPEGVEVISKETDVEVLARHQASLIEAARQSCEEKILSVYPLWKQTNIVSDAELGGALDGEMLREMRQFIKDARDEYQTAKAFINNLNADAARQYIEASLPPAPIIAAIVGAGMPATHGDDAVIDLPINLSDEA